MHYGWIEILNTISKSMTKWPALAYYWPTDSTISASRAIKKREKDNRTGEIWCHAQCYKSNPQGGNALFARKGPGSPHFWIGPGYFTKKVDCSYEMIKSRNSESYRYSQLVHDLFDWLTSDDIPDDWAIKSVKISEGHDFDIHVEHDQRGTSQRETTTIIVNDKNRYRRGYGKHQLRFDIARWPDSHIENFSEYGKRKIIELWVIEDEKPKLNTLVNSLTKSSTNQKQKYYIGNFEVSGKEIEKFNSIVEFTSDLIQSTRTYLYKSKFLPDSNNIYGDSLSSQNRRTKYIREKMAELNNAEILIKHLDAVEIAISVNSMREGTRKELRRNYLPTWPENWREKLLKFWREEFESNDFSKILEDFGTKNELISIVNEMYRMLFERDNPFFLIMNSFKSLQYRAGALWADIPGVDVKGVQARTRVFVWDKEASLFFRKLKI